MSTLNIQPLMIDFGTDKQGSNWMVTNDGVMGGLSKGYGKLTENSIIFEGEVSLENNGGFTKIDSRISEFDLSDYKKVVIRARGIGHTAAFRLDINRRFYLPYFKAIMEPSQEWKEYTYVLKDIAEYRMGNKTGGKMTASDAKNIIRLGFSMSNKEDGPFEWEVDYIRFE